MSSDDESTVIIRIGGAATVGSSSSSGSSSGSGGSEDSSDPDHAGPCDDFSCCHVHPTGANRTTCNDSVQQCQAATHASSVGNHPRTFCDDCRDHEHQQWLDEIGARIDDGPNAEWIIPQRFLGLLCHICQRDEAKLFWARVVANAGGQWGPNAANNPLVNPITGPHIEAWPCAANGWNQDLCICRNRVVRAHRNECHECRRNHMADARAEMRATYRELLFSSRYTIDGTKRINRQRPCRMGLRQVNPRQARRVFSKCPCGREPATQAMGTAIHMAVCMACRGVVVNSANLPIHLQQAAIQQHAHGGWGRSRGVHRFPRDPLYRVNQDIGILVHDPYPGPSN